MRFVLRSSLFLIAVGVISLACVTAQACPMCNQSIANEDSLPRAYMYSILFMLGMPATVFTGFSVFLHHKLNAHNAAPTALPLGDEPSPAEAQAPHSAS